MHSSKDSPQSTLSSLLSKGFEINKPQHARVNKLMEMTRWRVEQVRVHCEDAEKKAHGKGNCMCLDYNAREKKVELPLINREYILGLIQTKELWHLENKKILDRIRRISKQGELDTSIEDDMISMEKAERAQAPDFPRLDNVLDKRLVVEVIRNGRLHQSDNRDIYDRVMAQFMTEPTIIFRRFEHPSQTYGLKSTRRTSSGTRNCYPSLQRGASLPANTFALRSGTGTISLSTREKSLTTPKS